MDNVENLKIFKWWQRGVGMEKFCKIEKATSQWII